MTSTRIKLLTITTVLFSTIIGLRLLVIAQTSQTTLSYENNILEGYCAHDAMLQQKLDSDPLFKAKQLNFEQQVYDFINNQDPNQESFANYTLPVVVHVVHQNGPENITDAQVQQAIQDLNDAFENIGYYDQGTGVNTQIAFCLAQQDPDGNPTTGITHDEDPLTDMVLENQDIALKDVNRWDPFNYINIWVVREITSLSAGSGVAGYAYFPTSHGQPEDGIVVEAQYFGSSQSNSAVHVHEMGHYLGLYHTFQGGCPNSDCLADGDRVCDTPPDQTTVAAPCGFPQNSCSTDVNAADPNNPFATDQDDMIENYMDYGDLDCYSAFTQGQTDRMTFTVENTRQSLLNSLACNDPCTLGLTAEFMVNSSTVNIGESLAFNNTSLNFDGSEWQIDGVVFSNMTDASYTFNSLGTFTITLITTNSLDPNCIQDFSMEITVVCPVEAMFVNNNLFPNPGEQLTFVNTSNNAVSYDWSVDGMSVATTTDLTHTFNDVGVSIICLEADNGLCTDTWCQSVLVLVDSVGCNETFIKAFGSPDTDDEAYIIAPADNTDLFIGGSLGEEALIMRVTQEGSLLWSRKFDIGNQRDIIYDLKLDTDGHLIGSGVSRPPGNGSVDQFAFKYDYLNDNFIWISEMAGVTDGRLLNIHEAVTGGDYIVTGGNNGNGPGLGCDGFIMELDRNSGNINWMKEHDLGSCETFAKSIIFDNSVYTTGRYNFSGGGQNRFRAALSRLDLSGTELWTRLYLVGVNTNARLYGQDLLIENDLIITTGYGDDNGISTSNVDLYLFATDLDGNIQWAKAYDIPVASNERTSRVKSLPDGYLMYGFYDEGDRDIFLIKTDKQGNLQWAKSYGLSTSETGQSMIIHNGFIFFTGVSDGDIYLGKVNPDGELIQPCAEVSSLQVQESDVSNPYDGSHPLTELDPAYPATFPNEMTEQATLVDIEICSESCNEICDNGLDDDGDGLIDCYDPDCCADMACEDFYYFECPIDCEYTGSTDVFELEVEWTTLGGLANWCAYNTPIVGDVDNDGVPEVLGKPCNGPNQNSGIPLNDIIVVDGASGTIETVIPTPAFTYINDGPSVADLDGNGMAEIFFQAGDLFDNQNYIGNGVITGDVRRRIVCYEYDGSGYVEKWMSDAMAGYNSVEDANTVSAADFNGDGIAEVYVGNQIFNGLNGALIVEAGVNNPRGMVPEPGFLNNAVQYSVAANVLPDSTCVNCAGLELVAGNAVYSVHIDPITPANSSLNIEEIMGMAVGTDDGRTSLADVDNDGDLDALITSNQQANPSDSYVYVWDIQTATLIVPWHPLPTGSGHISHANIADFDGDGFVETGICTQFKYQVLKRNGNTFSELWNLSTTDDSGQTGSTVFDFNNDGQAEVVYRDELSIRILDGTTGAELFSEPCFAGTRVEYPVVVDVDADGETELLCSCGDELRAYGSTGTPWVSTRSVWNQHTYFNVNINDDLSVPILQQEHHIVGDSMVLNNFLTQYADPRFPIPDATVTVDSFGCGLDSFFVRVEICNIGDLRLGFETPITFYDDDPTQTAATALETKEIGINVDPDTCVLLSCFIAPQYNLPVYVVINDDASLVGPYSLADDFPVTSITECDYTNNIDSFILIGSPPMELDLGPDVVICDNGVIELNAGSGFVSYEWQDGWTDSTYTAYLEGMYWVTVIDSCGNMQSDTIEVIRVTPSINMAEPPVAEFCPPGCVDFTVQGNYFDHYLWEPSDYLNCDTCQTVTACPPGAFQYIVIAWTDDGCYSVDTVVTAIITYQTEENVFACPGESVIIHGSTVDVPGTYTQMLTSSDGCDSTSTITFAHYDLATFDFDVIPTCPDGNSGSATVIINTGQIPFSYNWDVPGVGDTPTITDQPAGDYQVTITDGNNCPVEGTVTITEETQLGINADSSPPTCFGDTDGRIEIFDPIGNNWTYSLDGINYQSSPVFENLPTGDYLVYLNDGACEYTNLMMVAAGAQVVVGISAFPGIEVIQGETVELEVTNLPSNVATIDWLDNPTLSCDDCANPTANPIEGTNTYEVTVIDENGCIGTAVITIVVTLPCNPTAIEIPNVFTPDQDGVNDEFGPHFIEGFETVSSIKVFDRWGEKVYQGVGNDATWDGTIDGKPAPGDVYVYIIRITCPGEEQETLLHGDITLIR